MSGGIGQGIDDLELLDDRAGPAMGDDERQGAFVLGPSVNEMNVEAIDLRDELRQCVQPRLARAPVVIGHPVAGEFLHRRQLDALCVVCYGLAFRPPSCGDTPAQVGELLIGDADSERTDRRLGRDVDGARVHAGCGHFLPPVPASSSSVTTFRLYLATGTCQLTGFLTGQSVNAKT